MLADAIPLTKVLVHVRSTETRRVLCENGGGKDGMLAAGRQRAPAAVSEPMVSSCSLAVLIDRRCSKRFARVLTLSVGLSPFNELWDSRGLRGRAERYLPAEDGRSRRLGESRGSREIHGSGSATARPTSSGSVVGLGSASSVDPSSSSMILSNGEEGKGSTLAVMGEEDESLFCEEPSILEGSFDSNAGLLLRCTVSSEVGFSSRWRYLR